VEDQIADLDDAAIRDFLQALVSIRLIYAEDGRYLSLALPSNPDAAVCQSAATRQPVVSLCLESTNS
jgi:hypothetical protein